MKYGTFTLTLLTLAAALFLLYLLLKMTVCGIPQILQAALTLAEKTATVVLVVLAIWGGWFRSRFAGPKLDLCLLTPEGHETSLNDGTKVVYYNGQVVNDRSWAPAEHVRVHLTFVSVRRKGKPDFDPVNVVSPLQLHWTNPSTRPNLPTISEKDTFDIGFVDRGTNIFKLTLYICPNYFDWEVRPGDEMIVGLGLCADNFFSKRSYWFEIDWEDGSDRVVIKNYNPKG